jgi:hypothetical protein
LFFTRRKVGDEVHLRLYGRNLERVGAIRFLGIYFGLSDREGLGAGRYSLRTMYVALIRFVIDSGSIAYG